MKIEKLRIYSFDNLDYYKFDYKHLYNNLSYFNVENNLGGSIIES